jgi:hypothetical protein
MNTITKTAFLKEMALAETCWQQRALDQAFAHLERAHILGQREFLPHVQTHLWMLRIGWARRDGREIRGQILRLLLIPLGHLTGRLPLGNTGGANVSAFKPMPIARDLAAILRNEKS